MDKKVIDNIVWYIPFRKLRDAVREYLNEHVKLLDENIRLSSEQIRLLNNLPDKNYKYDFKTYQLKILELIHKESTKESVKYICENGSNARMFGDRGQLLKFMLEEYVKNGDYKDKLFLEFGVFEGWSINFCSSLIPEAKFYGFDSFEGLPETSSVWVKSAFDVKGKLPKVNDNVSLIKGYFNETLPKFLEEHKEKAAFIHVDSDLYSSAKTIFENIYDRIVPNTVIQFDEYYNYPGWRNHEFKAFQEFCKKYSVEYEYIGISHMQVAVIIKSIKN